MTDFFPEVADNFSCDHPQYIKLAELEGNRSLKRNKR
jgi:hypothetical protein